MSDYAIEKLLSDVDGLIDAAGAGPVVLIGHDWGPSFWVLRDARGAPSIA